MGWDAAEQQVVASFLDTSRPSSALEKYTSIFFRNGDYSFLTRENFTGLELYDVRVDPGERQDVASTQPALTEELLEESRSFFAEQLEARKRVDAETKTTTVSTEERELLQALGYLQ
jgi:hypothetical protein